MIFEVDSTTEKLLKELQGCIEDVIGDVRAGQGEIADLIEEIKSAQGKLLDRLAAVDALAKTAEQMSQELKGKAASVEVKNAAELAENARDKNRKLLEKIADSQSSLENRLEEIVSAAMKNELASLENAFQKLDVLNERLETQKEELICAIKGAAAEAGRNRETLGAITAYLSLPGYKRFFRGMEAAKNEVAE